MCPPDQPTCSKLRSLLDVHELLGHEPSSAIADGSGEFPDAHRFGEAESLALGPVEDFPDGKPVRATAGELAVVVVREGEHCHALAEHCAHLSGPLSEGTLVEGCLRCPWHGSTFRLRDGEVVHGPATAPQPVLETRVLSGHLEIRLPAAD
ncbi:Rieske (2Fe-2S) protein [Kitasatospora sp. NPDC058063]|uniref:Rieske (2Fe-2S) protein n=1 Tax=unclassified Kitasatospora TaxID=2633591 RepID=UPI0036D782B2